MVNRTYTFLYKNGVKETMKQQATIEEHQEICRAIENGMMNGLKGYLRFGDIGSAIWVNVADVTRVKVDMKEELEIDPNGGEVH